MKADFESRSLQQLMARSTAGAGKSRDGLDDTLFPESLDFDFYTERAPRVRRRGKRLTVEYSKQLRVDMNGRDSTVYVTMGGNPYPVFDPPMLTSYIHLASDLENRSDIYRDQFGEWPQLHFFVVKSSVPGTFSLGGDLGLFARMIRARNYKGLRSYAKACVDPLARFARGFHLPIVTMSLVQGRAFGGGFELPLAGDIIIAEKQAVFCLPELMHNLFPGMGAIIFLLRKVGERGLRTILESGRQFSAQEMHELGVVDQVAETGQGNEAVREFIRSHRRNAAAYGAMAQALRIARGDLTPELMRIAELWVQTAMKLGDREIAILERIADSQKRLRMSSHTDI